MKTGLFHFCLVSLCLSLSNAAIAQVDIGSPALGKRVPARVEKLYVAGLDYLAKKQKADGSWPTQSGFGSDTAGVSAICTMAFLSYGEDPNFGRYAVYIRRGLRNIIRSQDRRTGLFKGNTYDFGFAMLCLADAYGAVDDELLWAGQTDKSRRTIGEALELSVKAALFPDDRKGFYHRAWYSTGSDPAQGQSDTSVAGSVLVGLLAARNAGMDVPDKTVNRAIQYLEFMTNEDGTVGYMGNRASSYGNSVARSSIVTLVMAMAKRKDSKAYASCREFIVDNLQKEYDTHLFYGRYYKAQALFQSDGEAWEKWNQSLIQKTARIQNEDGSLGKSEFGSSYSTGMSLLSLALNYRFLPVYER